MQFHGISSAN